MCSKKQYINNVIKRIVLLMAFLMLAIPGFAHGDLTLRILEKTKEIKKSPQNFKLYYQRGLLYQEHIEYEKALEDYLKSQSLGNTDKLLKYSLAEVNYLKENYNQALKMIASYLEIEAIDVKAKKLEAQILFNLKAYKKALEAYRYVINNMKDIRPEDVLEYASIILAENNKNYQGALGAIEFGLKQLGQNTISLQLKKLDYLEASNQVENTIKQYNYFILQYKRKELWYYKKAKYLQRINQPEEANISLKLATLSIDQLDAKFKNANSTIKLQEQIKKVEGSLNL